MYCTVDNKKTFFATGSHKHVADQPWVVFIHGAAMDHTIWTPTARHFARHAFNVLAVDLPGHGRSEGPAIDQIPALSKWLHEMLKQVDCKDTIVVGHSMGSLIGWDFAANFPSICQKLVLLGTSMPMAVTDQLMNSAANNEAEAFEMANVWSHSNKGKLGSNSNPGVWMFGHGRRLMDRSQDDVFHADLVACNDAKLDPAEVQCPTLLILGEADQMTPFRAGVGVADQISNAQVVKLAGCGHSILSEQPNEALDAMINFARAT